MSSDSAGHFLSLKENAYRYCSTEEGKKLWSSEDSYGRPSPSHARLRQSSHIVMQRNGRKKINRNCNPAKNRAIKGFSSFFFPFPFGFSFFVCLLVWNTLFWSVCIWICTEEVELWVNLNFRSGTFSFPLCITRFFQLQAFCLFCLNRF